MRSVIAALAPVFHSGRYCPTKSSSCTCPLSTSDISTAADSVFVAEAIATWDTGVSVPTAGSSNGPEAASRRTALLPENAEVESSCC